jgi:hypothetical protein
VEIALESLVRQKVGAARPLRNLLETWCANGSKALSAVVPARTILGPESPPLCGYSSSRMREEYAGVPGFIELASL